MNGGLPWMCVGACRAWTAQRMLGLEEWPVYK
jgi:hypothetical protein